MALNKSSKFNAEDGLFTKDAQSVIETSGVELTLPEAKVFKKHRENVKPKKPIIGTKSRTYTIDDNLYAIMNAVVKVLRDNDVKNEENGSLITESAFIRKAIRTEIDRLYAVNGPDFEQKIKELAFPKTEETSIKY